MKFFAFLLSAIVAIDSTLLMLMMNQNSVQNPSQGNQMNMMLPLLLLKDDDKNSDENKNLMIMMMMQGGNMDDTQNILPMLMLSDDSVDFKSFFLYSNMLKQGKYSSEIIKKSNSELKIAVYPKPSKFNSQAIAIYRYYFRCRMVSVNTIFLKLAIFRPLSEFSPRMTLNNFEMTFLNLP